jgi:hypothetical protein
MPTVPFLLATQRIAESSKTVSIEKSSTVKTFLAAGETLQIGTTYGQSSALFIEDPENVQLYVWIGGTTYKIPENAGGFYAKFSAIYYLEAKVSHNVECNVVLYPSTVNCTDLFYSSTPNDFEISTDNDANMTMGNNQGICYFFAPKQNTKVKIETYIERNYDKLQIFMDGSMSRELTGNQKLSYNTNETNLFYYKSDDSTCGGEVEIETKNVDTTTTRGFAMRGYTNKVSSYIYGIFFYEKPEVPSPTYYESPSSHYYPTTRTSSSHYYPTTTSKTSSRYYPTSATRTSSKYSSSTSYTSAPVRTYYMTYTYTYVGYRYTYTNTLVYGILPSDYIHQHPSHQQ